MFDELYESLLIIEKSAKLLDIDVKYIASKYIKGETDLEIPTIDCDTPIPEITFSKLLDRVKIEIHNYNNNIIIDENLLYGYVDYYFELLTFMNY